MNINKFYYLAIGFTLALISCKEAPPEEVVLPQLAIGDVTRMEGDENSVFEFKLGVGGENTEGISFDYQTIARSATAGEDFEATSGSLTIPAGEKESSIEVTIFGDTKNEGDEDFSITLTNVSGANISDGEGKGTIRNDDEGKLVIPTSGYSTPNSYAGMDLVWSDEFDGTEINKDDWTFEIGDGCPDLCGWGNEELQYYREENASIVEGNLVITAKQESFGGRQYTSTRMITKDKQAFTYGRIDIRAVLPEGQGLWPALWMLGSNISTVGWPACGEIDIMELVENEPNKVHGTVHYGNSVANRQFTGGASTLSGGKYIDEFHVFSLEWQQNSIKWYVDDQLYFQVSNAGINPYPFNNDFFFIFNVAVGGIWPGSPDASTAFPQYMVVDYVRVFQNL